MRATLAPIQTCRRNLAARGRERGDVDAEFREPRAAALRDLETALAPRDHAAANKLFGDAYADVAGKMVVTHAGEIQRLGLIGLMQRPDRMRRADRGERFHCLGDLVTPQPVQPLASIPSGSHES